MKITKSQIFKMIKSTERDIDIQFGANINHHRVFKNKKKYDRIASKKVKKEYILS
jgi:hypothetical protein